MMPFCQCFARRVKSSIARARASAERVSRRTPWSGRGRISCRVRSMDLPAAAMQLAINPVFARDAPPAARSR
jgi:hypothetical protein